MNKNTLLSIEDLYNYFSLQGKDIVFSSVDDDTSIKVRINEPLVFKKEESNDEQMRVHLKLCHTETNRNKSYISEDSMNNAIPSAYNIPILGYIWEDEDGVARFAGHEFYIDENNERVYEEIPVGVIPEDANLHLVESEDERKYLMGDGIIWRTYSKAADILEREENLSVSVELAIDKMSYNSKTHDLVIEEFKFTGVTVLQADPETMDEIKPGMEGACIQLNAFSEKKSFEDSKITAMLESIMNKIDSLTNFSIDNKNTQNGGEKNPMFEEILAKYEKTEEDITFEYDENTTAEEFEKLCEESFGEVVEAKEETSDKTDFEDGDVETSEEGNDEGDVEETEDNQGEEVVEEGAEDIEDGVSEEDLTDYATLKVSLNGKEKEFSLSMNEKIDALFYLVNDTYGEADNAYYNIIAYDDTKEVVMVDYWTGTAFRQKYQVKKDVYSLKGDRVRVFSRYVTEDEDKALDEMKANFAEVSEKLAKYEAEPEKIEKINSEEYANIRETEAFKELAADHFDLDIADLSEKLDAILLDYAKKNELGKVEFSSKEADNKVPMVQFANDKTKKDSTSRYGTLFVKK